MQRNTTIIEKLVKAGVDDDMIQKYQRCLYDGDKQGMKRLLCRSLRIRKDELLKDKEKLANLDYIIAKVEKTQDFSETDSLPVHK